MPELEGNGHFQMFTAIFTTMRVTQWVNINRRTSSDETPARRLSFDRATLGGPGSAVTTEGPKLAQMPRDQVIHARRELNLRQVAAAGEHNETSVRQCGSEQFGIRRRRRDPVFFALNHQQGLCQLAASRGHLRPSGAHRYARPSYDGSNPIPCQARR